MSEDIRKHSGNKYIRLIHGVKMGDTHIPDAIHIDVYEVLDAFGITCSATQHALKKLLCAGLRSKGSVLQDLKEARDSITRAIQMQERRQQ